MRVYRILLDPAAEAAGGPATASPTPTATSPTATATAQTPTPTTPAATPPAPARVEISAADYQRLVDGQARLAQIEAENQKKLDAVEAARLKALADKGEGEKALRELTERKDAETKKERDRADGLELERLGDKKDTAIATALVGAEFVDEHAAAIAREHLESRFEAVRDASGQVTVRHKVTLKPAAESIKDWLAGPESAALRKARSAGGAGARGGDGTTATGATDRPPTVADALIEYEIARRAAAPNAHYGLSGAGLRN